MDDVEIRPIHFEQYAAVVVRDWPERTSFDPALLDHLHRHRATVEGDTVTIKANNGTATYRLRYDLPRDGQGIVADRVDGDTPARLKQRARKYREDEG